MIDSAAGESGANEYARNVQIAEHVRAWRVKSLSTSLGAGSGSWPMFRALSTRAVLTGRLQRENQPALSSSGRHPAGVNTGPRTVVERGVTRDCDPLRTTTKHRRILDTQVS